MEKFVIEGGVPLSGTVVPAGNKNAALPVLAASVLTEDEVLVENVPRIRDVDAMLGILEEVGVRVDRSDHGVRLCAADVGTTEIDRELSEAAPWGFFFFFFLACRAVARPLARRAHAPPGRRRHPPPAPGPPPRRLPRHGRLGRPGARHRPARGAWTGRVRGVHGRAVGVGGGERAL